MAWWNKIDYDVEKVRNWIAEGKTQAWIGKQYNTRGGIVGKWCKKHNIKCQRTGPRSGAGHPNWEGGRHLDKDGYMLVYRPEHPFAGTSRKSYVREHRLVMEKHLGRYLKRTEVVHHKNKDKTDNRIENLELFEKNSDHLAKELLGKCPKWTEDGKRRIRLADWKRGHSQKKLGLDDSLNMKTSLPMIG